MSAKMVKLKHIDHTLSFKKVFNNFKILERILACLKFSCIYILHILTNFKHPELQITVTLRGSNSIGNGVLTSLKIVYI